ncbi:MAG: hypothetical protein HC819_19035 [Cyclobacteriaceae bacterium]|nr:hypothetical protein [Cyclobacteriaceae bacterium]
MTIFDNKRMFLLYGLANVLMLLVLMVLLICLFYGIYLLDRLAFVVFIGIHLFLLFFVKIQYLYIEYDEHTQTFLFRYNKRFTLKWQQKSRSVILPATQMAGYTIEKDYLGLEMVSFYKSENAERFALGPIHVGRISKANKEALIKVFGMPV